MQCKLKHTITFKDYRSKSTIFNRGDIQIYRRTNENKRSQVNGFSFYDSTRRRGIEEMNFPLTNFSATINKTRPSTDWALELVERSSSL